MSLVMMNEFTMAIVALEKAMDSLDVPSSDRGVKVSHYFFDSLLEGVPERLHLDDVGEVDNFSIKGIRVTPYE